MKIALQLPENVIKLTSVFDKAGAEVFVVGGAVRDLLMNREVNDWDFATILAPEEVQKLFPKNSFYNNEYGTVGVVFGEEVYEVTTYRTEQDYDDNRHPKTVAWGKSIEEDLQRRDLTINAIALKIEQDGCQIIDPYGGIRDLKNRIVKTVGKPQDRFAEDALRMMRAIRIACQLEFEIDKETAQGIKDNAKSIEKISAERVRDEMLKLLVTKRADTGLVLLKETGLLEYIIPELLAGVGMEQRGHHIYDVWVHSLKALKNCDSSDPITRLATLLHDIGKPPTMKIVNGVRTFHSHEVVGPRLAVKIGKRLKLSNEQLDQLFRLVRWHMFTVEETQTDSAVRRFIRNVTVPYLQEMISLRRADRIGSGARETSWRWKAFQERLVEVQKQPFSVKDLKIDGNDVMEILNIKPGRKVGETLTKIFAEVEKDPKLNEREVLMGMIKQAK